MNYAVKYLEKGIVKTAGNFGAADVAKTFADQVAEASSHPCYVEYSETVYSTPNRHRVNVPAPTYDGSLDMLKAEMDTTAGLERQASFMSSIFGRQSDLPSQSDPYTIPPPEGFKG